MISVPHSLSYTGYIVAEVISGAVRIARDVITPGLAVSPAIVELPLRCETDLEISVMASSITITPGTITLGISPATHDRPPTLFVHALYGQDRDELVAGLRDMERRLLLATRGSRGLAELDQRWAERTGGRAAPDGHPASPEDHEEGRP